MNHNINKLHKLWKEKGSDLIDKYRPYPAMKDLHRVASLFSAGKFYYYILNFHNLEMEYVHQTLPDVLGYQPDQLSVDFILNKMSDEDLEAIRMKEGKAIHFLTKEIPVEAIPYYKVSYFIRIKDSTDRIRHILHQATALTVSDTGTIEHALNIHTDVTHMGIPHTNTISFISLNNKYESYTDINPKDNYSETNPPKNYLSPRETDIVRQIANGLNNEAIAEALNISIHTVRTHRKNIFSKMKCSNAAELISQCLMQGVI